jgi:hypothetical protein
VAPVPTSEEENRQSSITNKCPDELFEARETEVSIA